MKEWYVAIGGETFGPVTDDFIRERITEGSVTGETLMRRPDSPNWDPAKIYFPELKSDPTGIMSERPSPSVFSRVRTCPKCGSINITRLSMYLARTKRRRSGGMGCLVILLFFLSPGMCVVGAAIGAIGAASLAAKYWYVIVLWLIGSVGVGVYNYIYFICESCGKRFMPQK